MTSGAVFETTFPSFLFVLLSYLCAPCDHGLPRI